MITDREKELFSELLETEGQYADLRIAVVGVINKLSQTKGSEMGQMALNVILTLENAIKEDDDD